MHTRFFVQVQLVPYIVLVTLRTWVQLKLSERGKSTFSKYAGKAFVHRAEESIALLLGFSRSFVFTFLPPKFTLKAPFNAVCPPPFSCYCVSYYRLPSLELLSFHHLLILFIEMNLPEAEKDSMDSSYLKGDHTII